MASSITKQNRQEGQEIAEFEEALRKWVNQCPLCKVQGRPKQKHQLEECQQDGAEDVRVALQLMVDEMTDKNKRRFERFSCCFYCYVPQAICQHWEQKEQGWWKEVDSVDCQFKGIVMAGFISMLHVQEKQLMGILYERMVTQDREKWVDEIAVYKWLGKKVR